VGTGQFGRGRLWARFAVWRLRKGWARLPIGVRLLWILLGVMLALTTPLMGLSYLFFRQSLETQQRLVQRQRLVAVANALDCELSALLRNVDDLSAWTDAHDAVRRRDREWVQRNITDWISQQFYTDIAVVVDASGKLVACNTGGWEWLRQTLPYQRAMRGVGSAGLWRRGKTIYLLAAAPVVDEAWSRPSAGALVVGKALDAAILSRISQSVGRADALRIRAIQTADALAEPDPFTTQILYDATEHPIALLQVQPLPAEQVWQLGALQMVQRHLTLFGGMLVAIGVVVIVVMVALLQLQLRQVVSTIRRLASGDWDARVAYAARDEFGYLARAFNQMAHQLQQAFEAQEQQREEILAQKEELEQLYAQLHQANQSLEKLNAELLEANRALAQAAVTDGLTGLKNRRVFQEALDSAVQMAERLQQPLSLIMFDIDHFKQFNDRFGHPAGDELLQQVAQVLRESARAYDVAARYGGEEFALLLPNTALEQAVQVAERLRQQIHAIRNPHAPVSASFGVATYRRGTPPATLVYEADAALYRAKRNGRDQVCVYQPEAA
jgi:diguanylate cyclase (GGDEF)-like protein